MKYINLLLRLAISIILLQTLFYKFTAAPEAVHIFSTLGIEPWGRILVGVLELIIPVLLFIPRTKQYGVLLTIGIMSGAIEAHLLTPIGIVVKYTSNGELMNDGGLLFILAISTLIMACILIIFEIRKIQSLRPLSNK